MLVIEGTYPWYRGGVSEWIFQYLKHCRSFEFSILQIATDNYRPLSLDSALYPIPENVVDFVRIPPPEFNTNWSNSLLDWYNESSSEFNGLMESHDLIHATNTGFAGWLSTKLSEESKRPLVLTEHAVYWLEVQKGAVALECGYEIPDDGTSKKEIEILFQDIAAEVYEKADYIMTVSETNIPLQKKLGAKSVRYVPNGVDSSWIIDEKKRTKKPVIGWVGRCAEMKNPLQFFEYVKAFNSEEFEADFLMLLSGANEEELENQVRSEAKKHPYVRMVWNMPSREYYPEMDILMITSHNESQPLVMFEALANKVLPSGRKVGDLTDNYGLTFPKSYSLKSIVQHIKQKWKASTEFEDYVTERYQKVVDEHTWESIFRKYETLLSDVVLNEVSG